MSNSYTTVYPTDACDFDLTCSDEEFAALKSALAEDFEPDCVSDCGMKMYRDEGRKSLYPKSDDGCNPDLITPNFLRLFGVILKRHDHEFMEFDVCYTSDNDGPGTHGGTQFRIYADGTVRHPRRVWE